MHNTRRKPRRRALAAWWIVSTVWMMSLACPAQYHPVCVVQPLEASLSTDQPVLRTGAGLQPRSEAMVSVELGVPEALVRALLREERATGNRIALQVPEALPMILATEDWEQIP